MGIRDYLVLFAAYAGVPIALVSPFHGLLFFSWLAYMRPQNLAWQIGAMRLSLFVAVALVIGLTIAVFRGKERLMAPRLVTVLLIALGAWFWITGKTAVRPDIAAPWASLFVKVIFISVITTGLVQTRQRLEQLWWVIAFSLGLLALKCGLFGVMRGGVELLNGPGGFMYGRNNFAVAINIAIPLLVGVAMVTEVRWIRRLAFGLVPFCVLTVLFTFSRGGLLTLAIVSLLMLMFSKRRLLVVAVIVLSFGAFFLVASDEMLGAYMSRAETIKTYEEDGSAMGRIRAWEVSVWVASDHPVFGVGPYNFMYVRQWYGEEGEKNIVAHNSFMQLLAENGVPAFGIFILIIGVSLWRLQRIWISSDAFWAKIYARMLQIAILGFCAGGQLLNLAYFDLFYHLIAMGVCLDVIVQRGEMEQQVESKVRVQAATSSLPWWRQPSGARV